MNEVTRNEIQSLNIRFICSTIRYFFINIHITRSKLEENAFIFTFAFPKIILHVPSGHENALFSSSDTLYYTVLYYTVGYQYIPREISIKPAHLVVSVNP